MMRRMSGPATIAVEDEGPVAVGADVGAGARRSRGSRRRGGRPCRRSSGRRRRSGRPSWIACRPSKMVAPVTTGISEQEREPGGRVAVEAEVAAGGDRDPRARRARGQRQDLGEADVEPVPDRGALERACAAATGRRSRAAPRRRSAGPPIIHGSPRWSSRNPEPRPPTITAGIVPTAIATGEPLVERSRSPARAPPRRSRAISRRPRAGNRDRGDQRAGVERDVEGPLNLSWSIRNV